MCIFCMCCLTNLLYIVHSHPLSPIECLGAEDYVSEVRGLLAKLSDEKVPKALPSENVVDYEIEWTEKGNVKFVIVNFYYKYILMNSVASVS